MGQVELTVQAREEVKKGANKRLRKEGNVPAVVYHRGEESKVIALPLKELHRVMHTDAGRNALINLTIEGDSKPKQRVVVVKDVQFDPVKGWPIHVDFNEISLSEKISVEVPVIEKGEAKGVKEEDGVLELPVRLVEISCLPTEIPEAIEINIEELSMNDAIHVGDLKLAEGIEILSDPDTVLAKVVPPHVEEEAAPEAEGEAEPEVIGEKERLAAAEGKAGAKEAGDAAAKEEKK